MRIIAILIVLLLVGLLVRQQLLPVQKSQDKQATSESNLPKVPTNPNDVNQFSDQMNDFVKKQADKQKADINAEAK